MKEWGLANVHLETWPFGRGWQNQRFVAMAVTPRAYPLIGYPKAWTPGTNGPVTGEAVMAVINSEKDFDTFRGKLRGKFVLGTAMRDVPAQFEPLGHRYTDAELADLAKQPASRARPRTRQPRPTRRSRARRTQFWIDEGVAAVHRHQPRRRRHAVRAGRRIRATRRIRRRRRRSCSPSSTTDASCGRSRRRFRSRCRWTSTTSSTTTISTPSTSSPSCPGADKADEVVMLGAHFDSWHTGTGATDNAAGSAVMMEAMRLLKTTGVKLRRTVRIGLWGGEEQGLLGSKEYVKAHFGDPATMQLKPEHAKLRATSTSTTAPARFAASICRATRRWRRSSRRGWNRSRTSG